MVISLLKFVFGWATSTLRVGRVRCFKTLFIQPLVCLTPPRCSNQKWPFSLLIVNFLCASTNKLFIRKAFRLVCGFRLFGIPFNPSQPNQWTTIRNPITVWNISQSGPASNGRLFVWKIAASIIFHLPSSTRMVKCGRSGLRQSLS